MNSQRHVPWSIIGSVATALLAAAALISVGVTYARIDTTVDDLDTKIPDLQGSIDSLKERVASLEAKPTEEGPQAAEAIPAGAVIAFETKDGCPAGWEEHKDAAGRFILGAGKYSDHNAYGREVYPHQVGDTGGQNQAKLEIPHMPSHSHQNPSRGNNSREVVHALQATDRGEYGAGHPRPTAETGGDEPFDIMPPYIVFRLCRKE